MPTLVLLPGLDGTGLLFEGFSACFGKDVEVIVASYPRNQALGYRELEAVARSFLPTDRPYFLLGESFSGPIALAIAASAPEGLQGLILCCTFAANPLPFLAFTRPLAGVFPLGALPVPWLSPFVLGRFSTPGLRSALARAMAGVDAKALQARLQGVLAVDVSPLLPGIAIPALYLRASEDRLVPRSAGDRIAAALPSATVVEFAAPHFLLQTRPCEAASAIAGFMEKSAS